MREKSPLFRSWFVTLCLVLSACAQVLGDFDTSHGAGTGGGGGDSGTDSGALPQTGPIIVNPTTGLFTSESGRTATFTIVLKSKPVDNVAVALSSSNTKEGTVSPVSVTFTKDNWSLPQTVTVTGVDDKLVDGNKQYTILTAPATASNRDPIYQGYNPPDVTVTNIDNESAGFTVNPTAGLMTSESGAEATFTVVLNTAPTADVTINLSSSDPAEGKVVPTKMVFTKTNYAAPQIATVTGQDDSLPDGPKAYKIQLGAASSSDPTYDKVDPDDVDVINADNDTAGFTIKVMSGTGDSSMVLVTNENGQMATFSMALNFAPTANVVVKLASSNTSEGVVSPTTLTFTTANWKAPQIVTVSGVDDTIADGDQAYQIVTSPAESSDPAYKGLDAPDVQALNVDNDSPGITVKPLEGLVTTEAGGEATFTIVLNSKPTVDVTIALSSSDETEAKVSPASVTFTKTNWNAPRTVTVTGIDDAEADGNQPYVIRTAPALSQDPGYKDFDGPDVKGTTRDNDSAGVIVMPTSGLTTSEKGDFATFTIALTSKPTSDVTIVYTSTTPTEGTASGTNVKFTPANYAAPQTITVTGVDDKMEDGNQVYRITTFPAESADPSYAGLPVPDVELTNIDDDTAGITLRIATPELQTSEKGDTATFTLALNSQPTMPVTIALASTNTGEGKVSPASLTFTGDNWNAPRTVTITGQDDSVQDGNQQYRITVAPSVSSDPKYSGIDVPDPVVTNVDNDQAGITVKAASGLTTNETGMTASFTIELNSQPTGNVVIPLVSSRPAEGTVSPALLTFNTTDWNAPQVVTVTGVDDNVADGNQPYIIVTQPAQSSDLNYRDLNPPDVALTNIDDDSPGFIIAPTTTLTTNEDGGSVTFTVRLQSQPTDDVAVVVRSSDLTEARVDVMTLVFTPANYAAPHVVTVTGVNDDVADGNQTFKIILDPATSPDVNYDKRDPIDVTVINNDNDSPGITVTAAAGQTKEDGTTTTFTVRLTSQPTADVTIPMASSNVAEGTIAQPSVVFTTSNWSAPQTITVTGVNDNIADGNQQYRIMLEPATSGDPNYAGIDADDVVIVNVDNDKAGVSVSAAAGSTTETGGTTTFTVVLNSQPTADVTIALSSSNTNEGTVMLTSLVFTTVNWAAPQTVTVRGVNDFVADGNQAYKVLLGVATGGDYAGIDPPDVDVVNIDDDSPGFIVTPTTGLVTGENGGTATFTVQLTSQPIANVTVGVHSNDVTEGAVNVSTLTFTPANYSAPQPITVRGLNDDVADGNQAYRIILDPAMSTDSNYNGRDPEDVTVSNTDNDSAGITVSAVSGKTSEGGGQATFTVVLNSQPTSDVTVHFNSNDATEGTVDKTSLTFNAMNWNGEQTVTITGVNDDLADGEQAYAIVFTATASADAAYAAITPGNVLVRNTDNDSAGIIVSLISGKTNEGGSQATFTVVLQSQPTANVVVNLHSNDTTEGTVDKTSLTFTAVNWNGVQTVTVTGVNDDLADGEQSYAIVFDATTSSDTTYANLATPADVAVKNTDDDSAGITVSAISGKTSEAGGQASFTIVLTSQPTATVTVQFNTNDPSEGVLDKTSVVFTTSNWKSAQTVTVTGVDDSLADNEQTYAVVFTATMSGDAAYAAIIPGNVVVKNTDNDSAGITVSAISGNTTEGGGQASFTVVLTSQPTADVVLHFNSNDPGEGTVGVSSLTFTPMNWNGVQAVTVTGVNDDFADGEQSYAIVFSATTSSDSGYAGITPGSIAVKNSDNDTAGITVSAISGKTSEAGGQATFTVVLRSEPTADVILSFASSNLSEGTVAPSPLTFTQANWNGVQTVTVTGVNDFVADGEQSYAIVFAPATSADGNYNNITPGNITVLNTDNDSAGINVSAISNNTTEAAGAGHTATFTVVLNSQPTANVTVNFGSNDTTEGTLAAGATGALTFTNANWSAPQTVTVTGVDDSMADGNVGYQIVFTSTTSADAAYAAITPGAISLVNIDDDTAAINVSAISHNTTEAVGANHSAAFTIVLNSQPSGNVTVSFHSSDIGEGVVSPGSVTFDGSQLWNVPQTVTVTGVDDHVTDGNQPYAIIFNGTTGGDSSYNAITPANVSILNIDNGTPAINVGAISGNTTEAGGTATFTIVLGAQPAGSVTVNFHSDDLTEGSVDHGAGVTFDGATWNVPQTVTVTGLDDLIADGDVPYHIVFDPTTGGDAAYNAITPANITLTNTDNDTAAIIVSGVFNGTRSNTTTEAAGSEHTATFTIVLTSQPTSPVIIHLASNNTNVGTVNLPTPTFDGTNWSVPQTVTITGVDNSVDDGDQPYAIVFSPTTGDGTYAALPTPATINMTNIDNDARGFEFSGGVCTTSQTGPAFTVSIRLTSQPTSSVTLSLSTSTPSGPLPGDGTISSPMNAMLTFDGTNLWNVPQPFAVTGGTLAGDYNAIVTASSTDPSYNGFSGSAVCTNSAP